MLVHSVDASMSAKDDAPATILNQDDLTGKKSCRHTKLELCFWLASPISV